jgi:hypothetical protein
MLRKIIRFAVQIVLVAAVVFFGYHYFTREELRNCVVQPLDDLSEWQRENNLTFSGAEVRDILEGIATNVGYVARESGQWAGTVFRRADEATGGGNLSDRIIGQAQYLYCRDVVEQFGRQD